ncbi:uncharacterized protein [Trachinotus anak]|uniref:uncharacterized protein n=1 Tax=Trachinotus anak TaxID=443729 RepID=UPI0039F1F2D4
MTTKSYVLSNQFQGSLLALMTSLLFCINWPARESFTQPNLSHQRAHSQQPLCITGRSNLPDFTMRTLLLASALFAGLFGSSAAVPVPPAPAPYSAFCRTVWLFAIPCAEVSTTIVQQIQAFSPLIGCEKCQYMLVSATPLSVKANHTSIVGLQAESLTFTFSPTITGGCRVSARSTSLGFTSLLDGGLNYCNLYNLLSASGLTSAPGFMEITSEWACLGYGLATCKA